MTEEEKQAYYNELKAKMKKIGSDDIPLSDHAEMWCFENSGTMPDRNTDDWQKMYESWVEFAFADFYQPE